MKCVTKLAAVLVLALGACSLMAQSLGDVAREQRVAQRPRSGKVYTNDDIPSVNTLRSARSAPAEATPSAEQQTGETKNVGEPANPSDTTKRGETKTAGEPAKTGETKAAPSHPPEKQSAEEFLAEREKQSAEWNKKISEEQERVAALAREVDTLSREHQEKLRQQATAAWLNYGSTSSPADEKAYQELLESKQQALEAERAKLQSLQEEASRAGVNVSQ